MQLHRTKLRRRLVTGTGVWYHMHHYVQRFHLRFWGTIVAIFLFLIFYVLFLFGMPSISDIETTFRESSIIYDRDGNQLYTIYGGDENRQYVNFDQISPNLIDAIVAMEDQRFFKSIGFDAIGIVRSAVTCAMGRGCAGGSSLSQQLLKNTLLANEKSVYRRKIQEIVLSLQLNLRFSKKKILELYLNKISFGSNSYGVEQATRRFFGKSATDISVLESAIIASLPKTPTGYNPYSQRGRLMGYVYYHDVKRNDEGVVRVDKVSNPEAFDFFAKALSQLQFNEMRIYTKVCGLASFQTKAPFEKGSGTDCLTVAKKDLMEFLNSLQLPGIVKDDTGSQSVTMEYQSGRKDRVLMRMYEDGYITDSEYRDALIGGLTYEFQDPKESIKYPHFVFYVKDYLASMYGEDFFQQGGWKIYTTIDPKLQDKAEELVNEYAKSTFRSYAINNGSLVALDTKTREVLAMVGSQDYSNKEIDGEVNIMTSMKQPGSSIKPFIYARAFEKNNLSTDTPIFDVEQNFGTYKPKNFDGEFWGPMTLRTALDASRNIPAIKMYYMAIASQDDVTLEPEHDLVGFLQGVGLKTIEKRDAQNLYGPPLALGSAEVRGIDFASAYATLANNGQYLPPNPILKLFDPQGNEIVFDPPYAKQAVLPGAAYMITDILSDNAARPAGWNHFLALSDNRKAAVKTGTSSKKKGEVTYPRDLWTIGYTPQVTTAVWTGNTDGKPASLRASGMESSALIWKRFMEFAHTDLPKMEFIRPDDVVGNSNYLYIDGKKPDVIGSFSPEKIQVDGLCNGKVTETTQKESIKDAVIFNNPFPIEDSRADWREAVDSWIGSDYGRQYLIKKLGLAENMITLLAPPENICERPTESVPQFTTNLTDNMELFSGIYPLEIGFQSEHPMTSVQILINDVLYRTFRVENQKSGKAKGEFGISAADGGDQIVTVTLIDTFGYSTSRNYHIRVLGKDVDSPLIQTENPRATTIKSGQSITFSGTIRDESNVSKIQIYVNDVIYGTLQGVTKYNFTLKAPQDLGPGQHIITIQVTDYQNNITTKVHTVTVSE